MPGAWWRFIHSLPLNSTDAPSVPPIATPYDLIVAVNGNYSVLKCRKALKPVGRYVLVGGALTQFIKAIVIGKSLSLGRKKMLFLAAKTDTSNLGYLLNLASEGIIKPVIEKCYSPETTSDAMKYAAAGHARGKVVIKWHDSASLLGNET